MASLYQGPPAFDFYSALSGIGDTLQNNAKLKQQAQLNQSRKAAFSDFTALDPRSPDYGKQAITIAQKLGQAGDQEGALKFIGLAQSASDRARQDPARRCDGSALEPVIWPAEARRGSGR
jgi:hypothetical protein